MKNQSMLSHSNNFKRKPVEHSVEFFFNLVKSHVQTVQFKKTYNIRNKRIVKRM